MDAGPHRAIEYKHALRQRLEKSGFPTARHPYVPPFRPRRRPQTPVTKEVAATDPAACRTRSGWYYKELSPAWAGPGAFWSTPLNIDATHDLNTFFETTEFDAATFERYGDAAYGS